MTLLPESLARAAKEVAGSFLAEMPPHLIVEKDPVLFLKIIEPLCGNTHELKSKRFIWCCPSNVDRA